MSLRVWLPLNGDLHNQGLDEITVTNSGAVVDNSGKIGKCYSFGGSAYMYTATSPDVNGKSATFWVYATNTSNFVAFCDYKSGLAFGVFNSYIPVSCTVPSGVTVSTTCYPKSALTLNAWNHVALVRNEVTPSLIELWINGEKQTPNSTFDRWTSGITDKLTFGARSNGTTNMIGKLNDFRIYDHALSAKEIKEISKALVIHYPLDGAGANENLLKLVPKNEAPGSYNFLQLNFTENLQANETYTVQFWDVNVSHSAKTAAQLGISIYWGGGSVSLKTWNGTSYFTDGHADYLTATFTITENQASHSNAKNAWFNVYNSPGYATGTLSASIGKWKLEKGTKATPWIPAPSDPLYTEMGFDSTIIYDESGFGNDGTLNKITIDSDSPRYDQCAVFTGTNSSWIKVNENNWMAQYAPEYTVSIWTYQDTWTSSSAHEFSCTESGGFNIEYAATGYLRHPIYVATNEEHTAHAYIYDNQMINYANMESGWHMITCVYDNTGTKIYLDGELHYTYNRVSYGVKFNTNARLYLGCEASGANPAAPYLTGKQSDFRFYYTALSPEDIKELYEVGMSIDNKQNIHTYEIDEAGAIGISKTGILTSKTEFIEEADDPNVHLYKSGEVTANHFYEE